MKTFTFFLFLLVCVCQDGNAQNKIPEVQFIPQTSNINSSLRGLCIVDKNLVWASGSKGTVLFTADGGEHWERVLVPGYEDKDFRDIHAFDSQKIIIANAGSPAYILRSENGGKTWQKVYENTNPKAFIDDIAFKDSLNGIAFGDEYSPGQFLTVMSKDGGRTWQEQNEFFPAALPGEGGFAASGSILQIQSDKILLATGAGEKSRIFYSEDGGKHWLIKETPILSGQNSQGMFSISFGEKNVFVGVGGDSNMPNQTDQSAVYSTDLGQSWLLSETLPSGYRSGVAFAKGKIFLAVGSNGADLSTDNGKNWSRIADHNLNAIRFIKNQKTGWAVGREGKIFKIIID